LNEQIFITGRFKPLRGSSAITRKSFPCFAKTADIGGTRGRSFISKPEAMISRNEKCRNALQQMAGNV
jgi:hypothetical protein